MFCKYITWISKTLGAILLICQIAGCGKPNSVDRFECFNRPVYHFNKAVDTVALKPVARIYEALIPKPLQRMVSNFFQNLGEAPNVANDILQGKFSAAGSDMARLLLNSTWGLGGLFDVASKGKPGIPKRYQDFGITLAHWGYTNTAYLVLPLLGPSTVRDGIGQVGNRYMSSPTYLSHVRLRNGLLALQVIERRTALLKTDPAISESVDEYVFVRNAYLQHRQYQITARQVNGNAAAEVLLDEPPE